MTFFVRPPNMLGVPVRSRLVEPRYQRVRVSLANGMTVLESRYLMTQALGRELTRGELVRYKDGNPMNTQLDNLVLQSRREIGRAKNQATRAQGMVSLTCPVCETPFTRFFGLQRQRYDPTRPYYCSHACATKAQVRATPRPRDATGRFLPVVPVPEEPVHGTAKQYRKHGCRCPICQTAMREIWRQQHKQRDADLYALRTTVP